MKVRSLDRSDGRLALLRGLKNLSDHVRLRRAAMLDSVLVVEEWHNDPMQRDSRDW